MNVLTTAALDPAGSTAALDRLGDEIAELSVHLEAATARLLDLIREFDARGGWNTGFRSCAAWLSWRVGLEPRAARERVTVVLTGEGSDETLGGYSRYAFTLKNQAFDQVYRRITPAFARKAIRRT